MARDKSKFDKDLVCAFRTAMGFIDDHEYICHALSGAYLCGKISKELMHKAQDVVKERIDGLATLDMWINSRYPDLGIYKKPWFVYDDNMLATRKAWLKSLIKEFGG